MTTVRVTHSTAASPETCWALMADFGNIDFFNPHLKESRLLEGSPERGLGTLRQCDLKDGRNYIREEVIDWQEGRSYTVDIYEGTMPVDKLATTLGLLPQTPTGTLLYMETQYLPRHGLLGRLLDALMLQRMFRGMLSKVIAGLAEKAEMREIELARAACTSLRRPQPRRPLPQERPLSTACYIAGATGFAAA